MITHSILERAGAARIEVEPFPHLVIEDALPAEYYSELEASYPSLESIAGPADDLASNTLFLASARAVIEDDSTPEIWRDFFAYHCSAAFFGEVCDRWAGWIDRIHPELQRNFGRPLRALSLGLREPGKRDNPHNRTADLMMDCQFGVSSPVKETSTVRGPHVDNEAKLFAALLYFRRADDDSTGGDLQLLRRTKPRRGLRRNKRIDPDQVAVARTVPYAANTLVMWINALRSIHSVSERSATAVPRRYVNFLGEAYGGRRADYFLRPATEAPLAGGAGA